MVMVTLVTGLPWSRNNIWKMKFFPGQAGKSQGILWMVREI